MSHHRIIILQKKSIKNHTKYLYGIRISNLHLASNLLVSSNINTQVIKVLHKKINENLKSYSMYLKYFFQYLMNNSSTYYSSQSRVLPCDFNGFDILSDHFNLKILNSCSF